MIFNKKIAVWILFLMLIPSFAYAFTINQGGDFTVNFDQQKVIVLNTEMDTTFTVFVTNNLDIPETFQIDYNTVSGWDVILESEEVEIGPGETKEIDIRMRANANFDYQDTVVGSDVIKIGRLEDYSGNFDFPVSISSGDDRVSILFRVEVIPEAELETSYDPRFSTEEISPGHPLQFTVEGKNITETKSVVLQPRLDGIRLDPIEAEFNPENAYQIFTLLVDSQFNPGIYPLELTVREEMGVGSAREWFIEEDVEVLSYTSLDVQETSDKGIFSDSTNLLVLNRGNVDDIFEREVEHTFLSNLFFSSTADYERTSDGVVLKQEIEKGNEVLITYSYNYVGIYLLTLLFLFLAGYIIVRRLSHPFDVETKVYDVERDKHEGIKSLKMRIGFENIKKEKIDSLKVIFKMPAYLRVQEDSFLLAPPNSVYKGKSHYRLEWKFKRFERYDSRILGFKMLNSKGVLGDIRFEDLEFEVTINGKKKKYYSTLPIVKG